MGNSVKSQGWLPSFRPVLTSGSAPRMEKQPVAASQTIRVGDPLTINASTGEVSEATATSTAIYGVAAENVTTTASDEKTKVNIWVADKNTTFMGQCGGASTTLENGAFCDIAVSTHDWYVDMTGTSYNVVHIQQHVEGDSTSDATYPGRVYFTWAKSSWDRVTTS